MARKSNTVTDLLKDEFFVKWVMNPDKESDDYWKRWIQKHPEKEDAIKKARELLLSFQLAETSSIPEADYNRVLDNLIQFNNLHKPNSKIQLPKRRVRVAVIVAVACSVILVLWFSGLFELIRKPTNPDTGLEYVTKTAPSGVKATIPLPDGSTVKLNSLSEIRYPAKFSDTIREVFLKGQAFFEIKKNPQTPFVVHTNELSTRVLGTSFDIQAFEDQDRHHVAVLTGKVLVKTITGLKEVLVKNEMILYEKSNEITYKMDYDYKAVIGWKDGIINFDKATFREVLDQLSRWYGVEFVIDDKLKIEGKYTGSFENESLENVLMGILFSSHFDFEIKNRKVFIK